MGFYLDMTPAAAAGTYRETEVPKVFWMLYFFAGFALACMGAAAFTLLKDLISIGSAWDQAIVGIILAAVPFYLAIGFKLAFIRKFVDYRGDALRVGYAVWGKPLVERKVGRRDIVDIQLLNQRPTSNLAPKQHRDAQYYIRGHWRILVAKAGGKTLVVDKHTEKEALEPLFQDLQKWWKL